MMDPNATTTAIESRRRFLAGGALLGTGLISSRALASDASDAAVLNSARPDAPYELAQPENVLHTACLQCNTGCGIKCKIQDGVVSKIDGNPYNPWTLLPHLDYATPLEAAAAVDGSICPKGQSGLQTAYDPYRLRKVLKRAGKRGEGKWITIDFDKAIREICDGGRLFAHVPGEESREVEGIRSLLALTDAKVAAEMDKDIKAIWAEKDKAKKSELVSDFKAKHAAHLDKLIDPDHPDFGPKNNQIVLNWGRVKGGRGDFYKRFAQALGSTNAHGHTTVCQGSLYFTCKAISEQYDTATGKFSGGQKFYWQADVENSRFILFVGANLFEANYGPPNRTVRLTTNLVNKFTTIAVADPRFSKLASKAWKWLPLKPGSDIPLAMAMIRWFFENDAYNAKFLGNANKAAAQAHGELSWSNATWLVRVKDGKPGKLLRAKDLGLAEQEELVALVGGVPTKVDPNSTDTPVVGDLFVNATLPGDIAVKSSLQILKESAMQHTIEQWCAMADCPVDNVVAVARELARWGSAAAVDIHRGPAQHTNGFYAVFAWMSLNLLLGNFDHKGGMIAPAAYDTMGKGERFDLKQHPGAIKPFGLSSIRHDVDYEKTTLFAGYPAKRNWYPLASDMYQEVIPSIGDAYPYPVKILFQYMAAPTYALPAGHTNIDVLRDVEKLPLFISNDIIIGTTSMYADYIFPDLSFLERWEFQGTHPNIPQKVQPIRQPVMAPIPEACEVFGQAMPMSFESMMLGVAEQLQLPGFGDNALGEGLPLKHFDDYYLRMVANLAFGEKPDGSQQVPDADAREIELFLKARRHLPETIFDERRWKAIVGDDLWPKVVTVLNRGGRFQDHDKTYKGDMVGNAYAKLLNLYQEKTAGTIHAGTGKPYPGFATDVPVVDFVGNAPDRQREGHSLALITHRTISQCKSRTITNPWLTPLMPENAVLINPADAVRLGLRDGQQVKVTSATNPSGEWRLTDSNRKPMVGTLKFTQTMRPGVVSFALGFGHWATGAEDVTIDGYVIKGEKRRAAGIHANAAMWTDPHVTNTCLFDPIGGSVSFYDTSVSLVPAST
jgi:tetrathionate reductase subunit A